MAALPPQLLTDIQDLFKDMKPTSARSVAHALDAHRAHVVGLLALHLMPTGLVELRYVDGPAEIHLDLWRSTMPPGVRTTTGKPTR